MRYVSKPNELVNLSTSQRRRDSVNVSALRRGDATVFADEDSAAMSDEETRQVLAEVLDDESLPRSSVEEVANKFYFKTPLNIATIISSILSRNSWVIALGKGISSMNSSLSGRR